MERREGPRVEKEISGRGRKSFSIVKMHRNGHPSIGDAADLQETTTEKEWGRGRGGEKNKKKKIRTQTNEYRTRGLRGMMGQGKREENMEKRPRHGNLTQNRRLQRR